MRMREVVGMAALLRYVTSRHRCFTVKLRIAGQDARLGFSAVKWQKQVELVRRAPWWWK